MRSCLGDVAGADDVLAVVAVAQLVESGIVIPVVVGSSPIGHPTEYKERVTRFGV